MTSFIPSITLPGQVFANPLSSILLPIALGASIGLVVRRMLLCSHGSISVLTVSDDPQPKTLSVRT